MELVAVDRQPGPYLAERLLVLRARVHRRSHLELGVRLGEPALPLERLAEGEARVVVRGVELEDPDERLLGEFAAGPS